MTELEFTKKPRRMTDPPQNQSKWLPGYEGVEVKIETDPARIAYFAREATWGDIMLEPSPDELADTIEEVKAGKVLSAAKRGGFGFRIRASRSCMDQMLRLAEGSSGAGSGAGAQTTRDNDQRNFNILIPNTINDLQLQPGETSVEPPDSMQQKVGGDLVPPLPTQAGVRDHLWQRVNRLVHEQRAVYGALVDAGIPPQDARYVALPLGFQTQWMHVMDLRALEKLCEQRLCNGLTQHETNYLVRVMRDQVVELHPWMDEMLRSGCEKRGQCVSRSMLFPPCGAFGKTVPYDAADDEHLYAASQNDAMQFAQWDKDRVDLEQPGVGPIPFALDPGHDPMDMEEQR
jgi:hypothetical protein